MLACVFAAHFFATIPHLFVYIFLWLVEVVGGEAVRPEAPVA
jgi:hypothetical protein